MAKTLNDIAIINMGQSPPGWSTSATKIGLPLLNGPTEFGPHHPTPVQYTNDGRKRAEPGDLLFCVRGSTTGRMNWANQVYAIGRGVAAIRHRTMEELQPFVRAVVELALPNLLVQATGSTFPNVSREQLENLPVPDLPIESQQLVAHVLGTLDDKFELNRQMNQTLEQIAAALFKSWFVDFDPVRAKAAGRQPEGMDAETAALFPDRMVESEIGEIPEGWAPSTVGNEFEATMGQSPPGETYNETGYGLPFYQGRVDFGFRYPKRRVYCTAPTRLSADGDTLVSVRAPVGSLNMSIEPCAIGRGVAALRHMSGGSSFTYYSLKAMTPQFEPFNGEGTVFGSISRNDLLRLPNLAPSRQVVDAFERIAMPLDARIRVNELQGRTLVELRDTLLPRLLSGELRARPQEATSS